MLPAYGVGTPRQGLVHRWRVKHSQATSPAWEAFVVLVDEESEAVRMEWLPAARLVPIPSDPPA